MSLTGKDRAALRSEAHHLRPTVHVGHQGVTDAVRQSLDEALRARELVKVRFDRAADVKVKAAANELAAAIDAEVIQVIGRTTTLYRKKPDPEEHPEPPSPWRQ